jgi:Leucine-rich repeat (LRR) protein
LDAENFIGLKHLQELDLSGNFIKTLDGSTFVSTPNLKILNLQNNNLAFVAIDALRGLSFLTTLDLSRNWLPNLHPDTFAPLPYSLKNQIILHENPIICNCDVRYLISWITQYPKRVVEPNRLSCSHVSGIFKHSF